MINHSIYDCDVFRSFFHLYNPYEPSESEKKFILTDILTQEESIVSDGVVNVERSSPDPCELSCELASETVAVSLRIATTGPGKRPS